MSFDSALPQRVLPGLCPIEAAVASMAIAGIEGRGAIFTRREVVDFILGLVGYTADKPLHKLRLLQPSMGQGDFLTPVIDRLLELSELTRPQDFHHEFCRAYRSRGSAKREYFLMNGADFVDEIKRC